MERNCLEELLLLDKKIETESSYSSADHHIAFAKLIEAKCKILEILLVSSQRRKLVEEYLRNYFGLSG